MDASRLQDNPLAERLAEVLEGAYALEGEIGRGGMGVVFAARDLKLKRRVAIKVLPPDLAFRQEIKTRFIREAQTAARLSHPHIVPIHQVIDEGGLVCFVMGFVDGESLGARLKRRTKLPVEEVRRIMKETADALGLAHAMNIIHRDIKPDNVLLEGTRRRVMVTDFGIAKALSEVGAGSLTGTGVAIGTPHYMSPEQAAGDREIDARSDLYSIGVVAYEAVTGRLPFEAPTVPGILMKQITEPAPDIKELRPELPDELAATIMRCLEKDPEDRWPTADSLRRALESRKSVPYRPSRSLRRGPGGRAVARGREHAPARREEAPVPGPRAREPEMVTKFRAEFASYVSTCGFLFLLNLATGLDFPWFLFPTAFWGFGIGKRYTKLWTTGYSWRDVVNRPPAPDAYEATTPVSPPLGLPRLRRPAEVQRTGGGGGEGGGGGGEDDMGLHAEAIAQMRRDQSAIRRIVDKLPESERRLLPDVVRTVDGLATKAIELARTLAVMEEVDPAALDRLDARVAELENEGDGAERDRRIELLERQRAALLELADRRRQIEAQFEACVLAVQNVRFDLLRLRSAGVSAVLDDLTSATQAARALSEDVEAAIGAAGEIRRELGR